MEKFKHYKEPENVEEFYRKPQSSEELIERMKILKEIPEDTSIEKVVIKLGNPQEGHKFDFMKDEEGRIYLIALPIEKYNAHVDIKDFAEKLYKKKLEAIGGGYIKGDVIKNEILIFDRSGSYGYVPKYKIKEILEKNSLK